MSETTRSSALLRRRPWIGFKQRIGHAAGQERQHGDDDGGTGPAYAGLASYFGFCETPGVLIPLTGWVRRRLRCALWQAMETVRRRRAPLLELGVRPRLASNTAGSGRGRWYLALAKDTQCRPFQGILELARSSVMRRLLAQLSRTAVYGSVSTVVWQGSAGDRCPYADQTVIPDRTGPDCA
jgi:hypothetical protein